jgi:inhibitor of KinA sporulation pathway (predicted exonuclease)
VTVRRDRIIIVDLEATCWEAAPPPGQQSEIIEIGICAFEVSRREIADRRSILVKPSRSKVSEFCTQLTTLTQEQVETGLEFAVACAELSEAYQTADRAWASWGNYDQRMFWDQCASFGVAYPFSNQHTNLKKLFGRLHHHGKGVGMAGALGIAGLTLEGTHHRGGDDAYNIARLLDFMLAQNGKDILLGFW